MRNLISRHTAYLLLLITMFSFQNCHVGQFKVEQASLNNSFEQPSCSVNGRNYYPGDQVVGYAMSTVVYPMTCGSQVTRTCLASGQFDGSVPIFSSCTQMCSHPDTGAAVDPGTIYYSYTKAAGTSQTDCDSAKVASVCQASTGQFSPAPPTPRFASCSLPGQTCAYTTGTGIANPTGNAAGSTVTGFIAQSATYPSLCGSQVTRTCQASGAWTGSTPLYTACAQKCLNPNTNMPDAANTQFRYYTINMGTQAECDAALRVSTCSATSGQYAPAVATTRFESCTVVTPQLPMGRQLYDQSCAGCHGQFDVSNLKGRTITSVIINNAFNNIGAMSSLRGVFTSAQVDSLPPLFSTAPVSESAFQCPTTEAEKQSSASLIRLTGPELRNTYQSLIPTAAWNGLANYLYLLPPDTFNSEINNFVSTYTADTTENISRFNEQVATQIVSTAANLSAFFGSCATTTAFPKTCFDTFLTNKGPTILRSALAADDNSRIWAVVTQASSIADQQKVAIQVLLNDPRFLYHLEICEGEADANGLYALSSYEVANRIAYGMTSAPPDATLIAEAKANKLKLLANVLVQVDRLAATQAFKNRVISLVKYYVGVESPGVATTLTDFLAGVNGTNIDVAATDEFNEFVNYIVFTQKGSLSDLLSSKAAFPKTAALATVMGTSTWTSGAPLTANNHPGILTKPYMNIVSNPNLKLVQRGKRIRISMLCSDVPQPSATDLANRPMLSEQDLIDLNRRNYIDKATLNGASCLACHSKMNQMGYATEHYDSLGRYIVIEKIYNTNNVKVAEHPVVSESTPQITANDTRTFPNVTEFQAALGESDTLQQCFSRKAFQFFQRKKEDFNYDSCRLRKLDVAVKSKKPLYDFVLENFKQPSVLYKRGNL